MKIKLERPLAFVDLEATGTSTETDRIVEIGICKIFPDGNREIKCRRFNPGIPIPPAVTEIHGISDEDVKDEPTFQQKAKGLMKYLAGCDIAGFNSNRFDIPMLYAEFNRAGLEWDYRAFRMIDVGNIFKINEPRTLEAAVRVYLGKEHEGAHGAEADAVATADVFMAQMDRYESIPEDLGELEIYSNHGSPVLDLSGKFKMEDNRIILNLGKHRGEPAEDHPDFLEWMVYKASFPKDTTDLALQILNKTWPGHGMMKP